MLNQHNLRIAKLAPPKDYASKYSLDTLRIEPGRTVAVTGHMLAIVTTPTDQPEATPAMEGIEPTFGEFEPFQVNAKLVSAVEKALPKKSLIPILGNAFMETNGKGFVKFAVVKDSIERPDMFNLDKVEGPYPAYRQVIPSLTAKSISVCIDAHKLIALLQALAPLAAIQDHQAPVVLHITDHQSPIRIDCADLETGQAAIGVIMPMLEVDNPSAELKIHAMAPAGPKP